MWRMNNLSLRNKSGHFMRHEEPYTQLPPHGHKGAHFNDALDLLEGSDIQKLSHGRKGIAMEIETI